MKKNLLYVSLFVLLSMGSVFSNTFNDYFYQSNTSEQPVGIRVYLSNNSLIVKNVPEGTTVEIYSAIGSRVLVSTLKDGVVDVSNLTKGLYIVRIGKFNQKLMIQ